MQNPTPRLARMQRSTRIFTGLAAVVATLSCSGETTIVPPEVIERIAKQLEVVTKPTTAVSGFVFDVQPVISILDANRQVFTSTAPVTVSVSRGNVTLQGTVSVNAVAGVVTFTDLRVSGAGDFTLTFSATGLNPVSFEMSARQTAASLGVLTQPGGAETGLSFTQQPVVRLLDHAGLPIPDSTFEVTASIGNGGGALLGTTTITSLNGLATFSNLGISGSGPHSLVFTAGGLTAASSVDFDVAGVTQMVIVQQPDSANVNVNFVRQPILELRGASNAVMRGANQPVTAAVTSGDGTLTGTATVTPVLGVATFTTLRLSNKGKHTLGFSAPGVPAVTSDTFTVRSPPVGLALGTIPAGAVSGNAFTTQPVVTIVDASNQTVPESTPAVTVTIIAGSGTLSGTTTVNAVAGVATFTNLRLDGSGPYTLRFAAPGLTPVTTVVTVTQVPATLTILTHPNGAGTGVAFTTQPVVRVLDQAGLPIATATTAITAAKATGTGTLSGTTTVNAVGGVATFTNLSIIGGGAHTLTFSATGVTSATSASFAVTQTAVSLAVVTQPAGATQDVAFITQPTVEVRDGANGVVTGSSALVTASVATGSGVLVGTTSVAAVNGVATFTNLQVNVAGAHSIRFTATALTAATSSVFTVTGPPAAVTMTTEPAGAVSGRSLTTQPVVTLRDAGNLVVIGSSAPVTVAIASGSGTLIGTTTVNAVAGVATFTNLRVDGSGSHTLTFTSGSATAGTSAAFTVSQTPTSLAMQAQPAGAETGQLLGTQPVLRVLDEAGLQVAGGTTPVTASLASGTGALTGTTTVAAVNGLVTFTDLRIIGGGPHTLQFAATGLTGTTSTQITIVQTPVSLGIETQPDGATVGLTLTTPPAIRIRDALANVVAGSTLPVTVAVASGPGTLSGTTTVNAVNGVATFDNLSLNAPGAHTLTFTSGSLTQTTSASFNVSQSAAKLSVQAQPAGAVSGLIMTMQPTVRVLDALNNLAGGFTGTVTATIASGTGALAGTVTINAVGGVATFPDLTIAGAGSHTLTFSATSLTSATSDPFTVTQNPFQLTIETPPSGSVSGSPLTGQPVLFVRDNAGLRIMTSTLAVTAAMAGVGGPPSGTLAGTLTVNAVAGQVTFTDLRVDGGGAHAIAFSGTGPGTVTSASFVTTQSATTLVMDRQPAGATSGAAFTTQPKVRVEDVTQHVVVGATTAVTAAIATGTGTLGGTTTVNAVDGIATFTNLSIAGGGAHTLTFTATNVTAATSAAITVSQTATSLGMETQPAGAVSGINMTTQPAVRIRDGGGLLIANATNSVSVSIASGTGTLVGTTTVNAVNGIATFTNLRINGPGAHTLQFTSTDLVAVTSATVTVTQQAASLMMETQPGGAFTGIPFVSQPQVRVLDHAGLQVVGGTNAVTAAIASGSGTLEGNLTVNAVNGLVTFAGLAITGQGQHSIGFTSGSLTATVSSSFFVQGPPEEEDEFLIHPSCEENPTPPVPAPLRTFYVDNLAGDDAALGTSLATAWKTLGKANNTVIAGDLVLLRGVFSGQDIKPLNSGTATNKITYRALPGDSARITLGAGGVALSFSGRSHIVVDGIAITNVLTPILIRNNAHHIWLFNLTILDGSTSEINNSDDNWIDRTLIRRTGTAGNSGISLLIKNGADRNFITRSALREAGLATIQIGPTSVTDALALDTKIQQNDIDNPWGTGMFLGPRSQGAILECNKVHNAGTGSTPQTGLDVDGASHIIRYNDVYQNGVFGILLRGKTFSATAAAAVTSTVGDNSLWGNTAGPIVVTLTFTP